MLADKYLRDELNKFAKYVIQQSRSNLTKGKKNASKELYNSLDYDISQSSGTTSMSFNMADYGKFQDRGVSGTEKKYNTPYSYKSKMPPVKAFDKWVVRKGLAPRGKGGKFASREGIKFAIAKSIYKKGIRPSMFFTKPFEAAFKRLPDELVEAYSIGLEKQIQVNINKK
jgi:hypothetical protein